MVNNVASLTGMEPAPPPMAVQVVPKDPLGKGRVAWYVPTSQTVVLVKGWENYCPHEVAHHLQRMNGLNVFGARAEWEAQWVQRKYWGIYPPKDHTERREK